MREIVKVFVDFRSIKGVAAVDLFSDSQYWPCQNGLFMSKLKPASCIACRVDWPTGQANESWVSIIINLQCQ